MKIIIQLMAYISASGIETGTEKRTIIYQRVTRFNMNKYMCSYKPNNSKSVVIFYNFISLFGLFYTLTGFSEPDNNSFWHCIISTPK